MLALEALALKVTPTVTPLIGVLTLMVVELRVVGVIHIVLIILHNLQHLKEGSEKGRSASYHCSKSESQGIVLHNLDQQQDNSEKGRSA